MRRVLLVAAVCAALATSGVLFAAEDDPFTNARQVTSGPGNHVRPSWSPDGKWLAYQANEDTEGNAIWLVNRDGSGKRRLTDGVGDDRRPSWSPDGQWISFDSIRGTSRDIWVVAISGGAPRQVTRDSGVEEYSSWSPDGTQLAFYTYSDGQMDLAISSIEGGSLRMVKENLANINDKNCTFGCHAPSWNKEGSQLSYTAGDQRNVMVINVDGSNAKLVTTGQSTGQRIGTYRYPDYAADGSIIFISDERGEKPWTDVWRLNTNGKLEQVFTRIDHGGPFAWAPDGRAVAFHSPRSGVFQIYVVELPGDGIGQFARLRTGLAPIGSAVAQPTITIIAWIGTALAVALVAGGGLGALWTWRRSRRG